jgi:hypothetical protein
VDDDRGAASRCGAPRACFTPTSDFDNAREF